MKVTAAEITRLTETLNQTNNPALRDRLQKLLYLMIEEYYNELSKVKSPADNSSSKTDD